MALRFRLLRRRTIIALMLSAVFVVVAIMSFKWSIYAASGHFGILIGRGGVGCLYTYRSRSSVVLNMKTIDRTFWLPKYHSTKNASFDSTFVFIPIWCLTPFVFIPTFLLWRKDRRTPEGHCVNCGYNLTGNVSGKCSECGKAV